MAAVALLVLPCLVTMLAGAGAVDTGDSAQTFLAPHNAARADVGVALLSWDDTVAAYARRYAGERKTDCALVHSRGPYGENIFWGSAGTNWTAGDALASWVQEKRDYNCSDVSCTEGKVCGHYTQVVWANTTRVGCAAVTCDGHRGTFILCEYDPPGNIVGFRPYAGCGQFFNRSAQISPRDALNLQNAARVGVGVGMLSWDNTVAAYAQNYAEKRKSDCLKVPSGGPYGENIFKGGAGIDWTVSDAMFSWLEEKQNYDCASNTCEKGACGEYTQLIWANSMTVGCASVTCDQSAGGDTFITCNYDPPGNLAGERPYLGCGQASTSPPPASENGNGVNGKENGNISNSTSSNPSRNGNGPAILPIVLPVVTTFGLISAISICIWRKRSSLKKTLSYTASSEDNEDIKSVLLDPSVIRIATSNFAEVNKLGEGGFGQVFKGMMPDGQEIAVKRLAKGSKQGLRELKNELLLVSKLQHRNLVKLLGACMPRWRG